MIVFFNFNFVSIILSFTFIFSFNLIAKELKFNDLSINEDVFGLKKTNQNFININKNILYYYNTLNIELSGKKSTIYSKSEIGKTVETNFSNLLDNKYYYTFANNLHHSKLSSNQFYFDNLDDQNPNLNEYKNKSIAGEIENLDQNNYEEIFMRFKFSNIIDEMIIASYKDEEVFLPILEILSLLQLNHKFDKENNALLGYDSDNQILYKLNFMDNLFIYGNEEIEFDQEKLIQTDLDYFLQKKIVEKILGMDVQIDMRELTIKLISDKILPMQQRIINEKKLKQYRNSLSQNDFPLLFDRKRNILSGGFFDYSATTNYFQNQSSNYSFQIGAGAELLGGDFNVFNQQTIVKNKTTFTQTNYKWRYAFLNNDYVSGISLGNINSFGLQSFDIMGVKITNEPIEARKTYGYHEVLERTNPNSKIEIYQNGQLIDIVESNSKGDYSFSIPINYGTTLLELHEHGENGEYRVERKMYQIPLEYLPKGRFDYSINFGKLLYRDENVFQGYSAFGINNWLTTKIGTNIFINDYSSSSFYSSTSARLFDNYLVDLTLAPNTFHELSINSVFSDLASINLRGKFFEENAKLNPSKIRNEFEGNLFFPIKINENMMSVLFRGRHSDYSIYRRNDFSIRTFYNYKNFGPSFQFDYYTLNNNKSNFESAFLNFRLTYSIYLSTLVFSGNIIDARFVYDLIHKNPESFDLSVSTTLFRKFRVQLSHSTNLNNSFSDTQLRIVLDLPFIRSNTTMSKNAISHTFIGAINYDQNLEEFSFYNRSMIGRSAATFKFFVDENMNEKYDKGENIIKDMDIQLNSIGNKRRTIEGEITINDLESYSKFDVKLISKNSRNPLWFPYREKFSFISDPHQYKEIQIPFYEAGEVSGSVLVKKNNFLVPSAGVIINAINTKTSEIIKIRTMSDGSFYHYGLKPGEYEFSIAEEHLERLSLTPKPQYTNQLIKSISSADNINEINFILE